VINLFFLSVENDVLCFVSLDTVKFVLLIGIYWCSGACMNVLPRDGCCWVGERCASLVYLVLVASRTIFLYFFLNHGGEKLVLLQVSQPS
jgi:hypothetical protein